MTATLLPLPGTKPSDIPYDQKAEESIVGYFLYRPEAFPKSRRHLSPDDFFSPGARNLYRVFCDMQDRGEPIALETVCYLIEKEDFYTLTDALCYCAMTKGAFLRDLGTVLVHADARRVAREVL